MLVRLRTTAQAANLVALGGVIREDTREGDYGSIVVELPGAEKIPSSPGEVVRWAKMELEIRRGPCKVGEPCQWDVLASKGR
jgi:hypothetical protein